MGRRRYVQYARVKHGTWGAWFYRTWSRRLPLAWDHLEPLLQGDVTEVTLRMGDVEMRFVRRGL